jgi:hypothetical protein
LRLGKKRWFRYARKARSLLNHQKGETSGWQIRIKNEKNGSAQSAIFDL